MCVYVCKLRGLEACAHASNFGSLELFFIYLATLICIAGESGQSCF